MNEPNQNPSEIKKAYEYISKRAQFILGTSSYYSQEDIEDLIQETMIETLQWEGRGINGALCTAAEKVLNRNFVDLWRQRDRDLAVFGQNTYAPGAQDPSSSDDLSEPDDSGEWEARANMRLDIEAAFNQFKGRERDVIFARFVGGYTWEEIAEMFPERNAKRWHELMSRKILPKVRKVLKEYRPDAEKQGSDSTIYINGHEIVSETQDKSDVA